MSIKNIGLKEIIIVCLIRYVVWNIEIWKLDYAKRYLRTGPGLRFYLDHGLN